MTSRVGTLVEMIEKGTVAGLALGASLRTVGQALGPPWAWEDRWLSRVPLCWIYGDAGFYFDEDEKELALLRAVSITPNSKQKALHFEYGSLKFDGDELSPSATTEEFFHWAYKKVSSVKPVLVPTKINHVYMLNGVRFEFHQHEDDGPYILNDFSMAKNYLA